MIFDIDRVKELTKKDCKNSLAYKTIKVGEEVGEFHSAILAYIGASNASKSSLSDDSAKLRANVLEEACDILNCTMNVLFNEGFTDEEIKAMFDRKLSKWESKL